MTQVVKEKNSYFSIDNLLANTRANNRPAWLINLLEKAGERYEKLDFPTTRDEEWKYTNIAPILKVPYGQPADHYVLTQETVAPFTFEESRHSQLVFLNGRFSREFSNLSGLPEGIIVSNLAQALAEHPKLVSGYLGAYADHQDEVFTALNTAQISDGAFIYIPKIVEAPIHLLFISTAEEPFVSHPRVLIVAAEGAIASIIESYVSPGEEVYFTNAVTEVYAAQGSVITHYRLQDESERAFHIATTEVFQERDSSYSSYAISLGGEIVRHNLNVLLSDEHIETTIDGLYVVSGRQHVDNHTLIDHLKPHCTSHQLYKGILDGKSRAVFNGKVFVREGALLTDAHQLNKNLLLSGDAIIDTKPQLEIFADDVKCSHGAAVGQLEDEELFYLSTRGISPERARALLTYGFAEDVISKIKLRSVREQLDKAVLGKLHQNLEID
jgi:Fe-S cluster assembly protein SufD